MDCPHCEQPCVDFSVPENLQEYAPEGAGAAAICPTCLRTFPAAADDTDREFTAVGDFFPTGDAGVALALAVGKLDSLALNRTAIEMLLVEAARAGADVLLALDRLAAAGSVQPHFDIDRRRVQIEQLLD
jgi:hypothetical protein